jgi:hypothetical protein
MAGRNSGGDHDSVDRFAEPDTSRRSERTLFARLGSILALLGAVAIVLALVAIVGAFLRR